MQKGIEDMASSNFIQRILSSVVIVSVASLVWYIGVFGIFGIVMLIFCVALYEILDIAHGRLIVYGIFSVTVLTVSLLYVYHISKYLFLWMILNVWVVDVCAYCAGKCFKGAKIAPKISAGKTWSGLFGGILAAILVNYFVFVNAQDNQFLVSALLGILVAVIAQIGDFLESWFKRMCKVKDSGNFIPGHGGVLDRIDGFLLFAPMTWFCSGLIVQILCLNCFYWL